MTGSDYMTKTILAYLEQRVENDELFAVTYRKPNKNIDDCITYILNTVHQSGINGFTDDEIFSMALHYYQEDEIKPGERLQCQVVVNHTIVLTEEEKAQARQKAIDKAVDEAYTQMKKGATKSKAKPTNTSTEQSLF